MDFTPPSFDRIILFMPSAHSEEKFFPKKVIIPKEIKEMQPQIWAVSSFEIPNTFPQRKMGLYLHKIWRDSRGYNDERIIGKTQRLK